MAHLDIGIDLGTSTIIGNDSSRSIILREPALAAIDTRTDTVLSIGTAVYEMVGRTPPYIKVVRPLQDGVISDYKMTEVMIKYLLRKISGNQLIKPRVTICVPSSITGVESQAVIDAAVAAGARNVYLIEEPVAAAIGAGIDLSLPNGNMIVDIGGGTCDIAVLSLNGIVCKTSLKMGGQKFDHALIKHMRTQYSLLVGERISEQAKIQIGSVDPDAEEAYTNIKGRDLISGLPKQIQISRSELYPVFEEIVTAIVRAAQSVLEKTPPELVGDIHTNGILLTGGGALIHGLETAMTKGTKVPSRLAENPVDCVAIGTAKAFDYLDTLFDGFVNSTTHHH